jgi:cytochrome b involved in lipid metabolism
MTLNRKLSLIFGVIIIIGFGSLAIVQHVQSQQFTYPATPSNAVSAQSQAVATPAKTTPVKTTATVPVKTTSPTAKTTPAAQAPGTYTMADVALHNSAASCWSAINGGVYDLTSWINQHPGGQGTILSICGIDGSSAFNNQHGGQRRPASELTGFQIGTLTQ